MHFQQPSLNQRGSNFQSSFCWSFILDLLIQHKFRCVNLISRSWRTWKNKPNKHPHTLHEFSKNIHNKGWICHLAHNWERKEDCMNHLPPALYAYHDFILSFYWSRTGWLFVGAVAASIVKTATWYFQACNCTCLDIKFGIQALFFMLQHQAIFSQHSYILRWHRNFLRLSIKKNADT